MTALRQWLISWLSSPRLPDILLWLAGGGFLCGCWLRLVAIEKLAPPDFYKYFNATLQLSSGHWKTEIIPPLFPWLLHVCSWIPYRLTHSSQVYIVVGQLLSLAAGIAVMALTYAMLKSWIGPMRAVLGVVLLIISPWFQKLLAQPITDMLFLCFTVAVFHACWREKKSQSLLWICLAMLTRFEGLILTGSAVVRYFRWRRQNLYYVAAVVTLFVAAMVFFWRFANRVFYYLRFIIFSKGNLFYLFLHPGALLGLVWHTIFFFLPASTPTILKIALLGLVFAVIGIGAWRVLREQRGFALAMFFFAFSFIALKGYDRGGDPEFYFRRFMPIMWIAFVLLMLGLDCGLQRLQQSPLARWLRRAWQTGWGRFNLAWRGLVILAGLCILTCYFWLGFQRSAVYIESSPSKSGFVVAQWLNTAHIKSNSIVLLCVNWDMVSFYLKPQSATQRGVAPIYIVPPFANLPPAEWRRRFIQQLIKLPPYHIVYRNYLTVLNQAQQRKFHVDYIVFDNYYGDLPEDIIARRFIFNEIERGDCFKSEQKLLYKGIAVAFVVKPDYHALLGEAPAW